MKYITIFLTLLLFPVLGYGSGAVTVTIDYNYIEDSFLHWSNPNNNYGTNINLHSRAAPSHLPSVIRVKDIESFIPAGATIIDAGLMLKAETVTGSHNVSLYQCFKSGWTEAGVTYNDWITADYEWSTAGCGCVGDDGSPNYQDGGACATATRDRKNTAESTVVVNASNTWFDFAISNALAQAWLDGTVSDSGGVYLDGDTDANIPYCSSEHGTTANRPYFYFTYQTGLYRGPYLTFNDDPKTTVVVNYRTESSDSGYVCYGLTKAYPDTIWDVAPDTLHHIKLTGLNPNNLYYYKVSAESRSDSGSFYTAPNFMDQLGKIVYLADTKEAWASTAFWNVMADVIAENPRFIVLHGDIAQTNSYADYDTLFIMKSDSTGLFKNIPFIAAPGNHDDVSSSWDIWEAFFAFPTTGVKETYYSIDYGPLHFVVLNTCQGQSPYIATQTSWLSTDLSTSTAPYKFICMHHPAYFCGPNWYSTPYDSIRSEWSPLFESNHVTMVTNGHLHGWVRSQVDNVKYVTLHNGGAGFFDAYPPDSCDYAEASFDSTYGYTTLTFGQNYMEVLAKDTTGTTLDSFRLSPYWNRQISFSIGAQ